MADKSIDLVSPSGALVTVPEDEHERALGQGYRPLSPEQEKEVARRRTYGQGVGNELRAGAEGAARGLTFGLSDYAMEGLGADQVGLAERKERNPASATTGEMAGVAGGLLLPGGIAGALGKGVRGAAALGEGAAALTGRGLAGLGVSEASGLGARALAQAAEKGVGSAVEGSLYGLGQGISETALGDPEDAAQKLLAHAGMGALLGLGMGAASGALGGVGSAALRRFRAPSEELVSPLAKKAIDAPESLKAFAEDLAGEQALDAAGLMKRDYKALQRAAKPLGKAAGDEETAMASEAHEALTLMDEAKRIMREKRLARAGDDTETVGNRVQGAIDEAHGRAKKFIADLDAHAEASGAPRFNLSEYADELEEQIAKPLMDRPMKIAELESLQKQIQAFRDVAERNGPEVSFAVAEQIKRDFDGAFNTSAASKQVLREARGLMNKRIEAGVQDVAKTMEKDAFDIWKQDKRTMEALLPVRKANESRQAALQSNNKISLTGWMSGLTTLGAIGLNPAGLAAAGATALTHKIVRERGNAFVSDMAARAAQAMGAETGARALQLMHVEKAGNIVTRQISDAVAGLAKNLSKVPSAAKASGIAAIHEMRYAPAEKGSADEKENAYDARMTELSNLTENPAMLEQRLNESLSDLTRFAPRVATEMKMQVTQALNYVLSKAPRNPYLSAPRDIRLAWRPSTGELASFERTMRAVHHPLEVVKAYQHGGVSKEAAEALRNVYPYVHNQIVQQIVPHLAEAESIPLQRRLEIADLLGITLDSITSPALGATMQQAYNNPPQQPAAPRAMTHKNIRAKQSMTQMQRALEGE